MTPNVVLKSVHGNWVEVKVYPPSLKRFQFVDEKYTVYPNVRMGVLLGSLAHYNWGAQLVDNWSEAGYSWIGSKEHGGETKTVSNN